MKFFIVLFSFFVIANQSNSQLLSVRLEVSDGIFTDTLFFGLDSTATNGIDPHLGELELPPRPPTGVFDARFTGDLVPPIDIGQGLRKDYRFGNLTTIDTIKHMISFQLSTGQDNFSIRWGQLPPQLTSMRFQDPITGTLFDTVVLGTGSYVIRPPYASLGKVLVSARYNMTLPVELALFSFVIYQNDVVLNWITASEYDNSGFEIQRKIANSNSWSVIDFVEGYGNSHEMRNYQYTDRDLQTGKYNYRLKQIDHNGNFEYYELQNDVVIGLPEKIYLSQNFPNPFNPATTIEFNLVNSGNVRLSLFDASGRIVKNLLDEFRIAGYYNLKLNASDLASGSYYYVLDSGGERMTRKFVVVK